MRWRSLLAGLLWLLGGPALAGPTQLDIVPLRHRTVDEAVAVLRPLASADASVSGMNGQLILRAPPAELRQLREVLAAFDTPRQRLLISVRRQHETAGSHAGVRVQGRLGGEGGSVTVGRPGPARAEIHDSRGAAFESGVQQIQVLDGGLASIAAGESRAAPQRQVVRTPYGTRVVETTVSVPAQRSLQVRPQLRGDQVTLEILADDAAFVAPGSVERRTQQVASVVSGRLGEWIDLGGIDSVEQQDSRELLGQAGVRRSHRTALQVRVEVLPSAGAVRRD